MEDIILSIPLELRIYVLAGLVLIDTTLGVTVAARTGNFDWERLPDFLWNGMIQKVLAYAGAHVLFMNQDALPGFSGAIPATGLAATFTAVAAGLVVGIRRKITQF